MNGFEKFWQRFKSQWSRDPSNANGWKVAKWFFPGVYKDLLFDNDNGTGFDESRLEKSGEEALEGLDDSYFTDSKDLNEAVADLVDPEKWIEYINQSRGMMEYQAELNNNLAKDAFDRELSARSTQYQTAVADMEAAGINPIVAYSQGGAGNISSSAASVQQGDTTTDIINSIAMLISAVTGGLSSGKQATAALIKALK